MQLAPVKPPPPPAVRSDAQPRQGFLQRNLFDYPASARAFWLAIVTCGALALLWALSHLHNVQADQALGVLTALSLVALASSFTVKLPRTTYSLGVADVFVFMALVTVGVPTAVLATGIEAGLGTLRTSKRLSSRLSSPAAAMGAMVACGWTFELLQSWLLVQGQTPELASLLALCAVALIPYAGTTLPLMAMMALKKQQRMRPLDWLADSSWMAASYLAAAFVAGLVHLNALRFGPAVTGVAAALVLGMVLLLRVTLRRQEAERQSQDALVSAAQHEAALSQQRFMAAFTHAAIGMAIVKPGGGILQVNQALCNLFGHASDQLLQRPFCSLLFSADAQRLRRQAQEVLARPEESFSMELLVPGADASELWVALHCSTYDDPGGSGQCLIYQLHDITSRHLAETRLHHIAYHDGLTDLANRNYFHERLEGAVERTRLDAEQRFAVMFLDLDRFKMVNDSLGHITGNRLLQEVAQRLRTCVRPGDLVARLGGDEFAVLLEALHDPETGLRLAQRVLDSLSQPLMLGGTEVVPGASMGITFSDLGYRTVDEVLRDADLAMYEAKAGGRGRVVLFDSSMHEKVAEKLALENDLRHAIGEGQLSVHFQPLYELEPYRLSGFEALARWTHPTRGPISPAVFIALAEESGHIEALTDWIIEHALSQLALWQRSMPGAERLGMHINISSRDLVRPSLVAHVGQVLHKRQVAPGTLTLEITETTLMGRLDMALQIMGQLRDVGVRFSIDDFGTGYSSLAYLSTLPIDSLKIDRSFVMGLHDQPQNVEIVRAVLNLGLSLGRRVVAEGIETAEQLATLRKLGVPVGQGYFLSRPLRAEQVFELLTLNAPVAA